MSGRRNTVRGSISLFYRLGPAGPRHLSSREAGGWARAAQLITLGVLSPEAGRGRGTSGGAGSSSHPAFGDGCVMVRTSSIAFRSFMTASLPVWTVLPRVTTPNVLAVSPTEILFFLTVLAFVAPSFLQKILERTGNQYWSSCASSPCENNQK